MKPTHTFAWINISDSYLFFVTRKSSCVKTHEANRPRCILNMACPVGERGYPSLVLARGAPLS